MDHPLNGNLRAPEDHLRGLSTEIVDDVVVKIAGTQAFWRDILILAANKHFINMIFHH